MLLAVACGDPAPVETFDGGPSVTAPDGGDPMPIPDGGGEPLAPCANATVWDDELVVTAANIEELANARTVTGTLTITQEVGDLSAFTCLVEVGGSLILHPRDVRGSGDGFPNLERIGVDLAIGSGIVLT